jgi:hypothetical protein
MKQQKNYWTYSIIGELAINSSENFLLISCARQTAHNARNSRRIVERVIFYSVPVLSKEGSLLSNSTVNINTHETVEQLLDVLYLRRVGD